jgi:hypothetical protein
MIKKPNMYKRALFMALYTYIIGLNSHFLALKPGISYNMDRFRKGAIMKKLVLCVLFLTVVLGSGAFAMFDVAAQVGQYNISGSSKIGYGLQIGLPILPIPMVSPRLEAMYVPIDSSSSFIPISLNGDFKFPMLPIYVGAGIGYLLYNNSTAGFSAPGAMIYNAHVGYIYDLAPMTSLFAQLGYEGGQMNYSLGPLSYQFRLDSMSIKGGIRFGI